MAKMKRNPVSGQKILTARDIAAQDAKEGPKGRPLLFDADEWADAREYLGWFVEQVQKKGGAPLTVNAVFSKIRERYGHISDPALRNWLNRHHPGILRKWVH
jgi:hypothetical protein